VVAFAGYKQEMDNLFKYNVGLPSRFPYTFTFEDYSDEQLLKILKGLMTKKKSVTGQTYRCADNDDKYAKLAIAPLGKLRKTRGFGNARAVNTLFNRVSEYCYIFAHTLIRIVYMFSNLFVCMLANTLEHSVYDAVCVCAFQHVTSA
jgi:hypothetical protein